MTDTDILNAHGFTPEQAAKAMAKAPSRRTTDEQALVRALVANA